MKHMVSRCCLSISCAIAFVLQMACQPSLSEQECTLLLERYTEKVIDQSRPSATPGERARLVREAKSHALLDPEFEECSARVSRDQFDCAMEADNADQMERCLL